MRLFEDLAFLPFSSEALWIFCSVWKHKATCPDSLLSSSYLYWGWSLCQMLALYGHLISNDAKWPHELSCPGVKRGRPGQPLTPGSFKRLRSKHVPIDQGRRKGRRFSFFASIQLTHQLLNASSVFIKTLSIDSQAAHLQCPTGRNTSPLVSFFLFLL